MGEGRGEGPALLFCDNETNVRRLCGRNDAAGFFKDAFHEYIVRGNQAAVNPQQTGTKAGLQYKLTIPAGASTCVRLRLAAERGQRPGVRAKAVFPATDPRPRSSR